MKEDDKLHAYWNKREKDIGLHWPGGIGTKGDAHYLSGIFNSDFIREMEARGYDLATLKFSIEPKAGNIRFTSQMREGGGDADQG